MPTPKLLDQVRTVARMRHFSLSTERAYVAWIRRFILFHHKKHPKEMAEPEIRQFISHLAVDARVSASTQTVALSAILFLYRDVLKQELPYIDHIERAKPSTNSQLCLLAMKYKQFWRDWTERIACLFACFTARECG